MERVSTTQVGQRWSQFQGGQQGEHKEGPQGHHEVLQFSWLLMGLDKLDGPRMGLYNLSKVIDQ